MSIRDNIDSVTFYRADQLNSAAAAFRSIVDAIGGLRIATCADITSQEVMVDEAGDHLAESMFGWTEPECRWWQKPLLALDSPLPLICRYEDEPFWCNAEGIWTRHPNPYLKNFDLSNFETRAFVSAAIVISIHLAFSKVGAVSFSPFDPSKTDLSREYQLYAGELALYAKAFVCSYTKVFRKAEQIPGDCRLTKREVQCMRWAAAGKTDTEIAILIGLTRATVRYHITNAVQKLDAVNRCQAVYKAQQLGYI